MTTAANNRHYFVIACVCLLIIAAALRFYNLTGLSLRYDEAKVALNSIGAISEVWDNTRYENSSPILYPIALWAVQKATSTEFSVRFLPAAASALTVGALLLLMPRVGVARRTAFIAALLAALSAAAIANAHDAREYSVDALCAVLIIAGALRYLRDGGKGLLCAALFVGPLLQYGLVLFGAAALGVVALAPAVSSQAADGGGRRTYGAAVGRRLRERVDLLLPIACFGAACALSWWLTARYQWTDGGWGGGSYLVGYYYQNGFDAAAIAQFAIGRIWDLMSYHMPPVVAAAALLGFAGLLPGALRRRRLDALALLAALAVGIAICAALMNVYPLGDVRQCLYLGPIIFLAAGGAFHSLAGRAAAAARRERVAPALTVAVVGVIAFAGANEIWRYYNMHQTDSGIEAIFAALEEREREGDAVYVSRWGLPLVAFYKREKPDNYYYSKSYCWEPSGRECVPEMFDEVFRAFGSAPRIWLIHAASVSVPQDVAAYSQGIVVEEAAANEWVALHLITGHEEATADIRKESADASAEVDPPLVLIGASAYDVYTQGDELRYVKQPCVPADTEERFFLHVYPREVNSLPERQRKYGYENVGFDFQDYGAREADKCLMRRALPDYPIKRIHTGQYVYPDGPVIWETGFQFKRFNSAEWVGLYDEVVSVAPRGVGIYDVYIQDRTLYYAKRPCVPSDVKERFFLILVPEDVNRLPARQRQDGYENINFNFFDYGFLFDDKCLARIDLPEYAVERVHTGQYIYPDGAVTWETGFSFERFNLDEWLAMYDEVASVAPRAASTYNVYLRDDALHYAKQPCVSADTEGRFFLNIYPEDTVDLPAGRRQYGHGVANFGFQDYGLLVDDKCLASYPLPDYPVKHIHTGQYIYPDGPVTWETEFPFRP